MSGACGVCPGVAASPISIASGAMNRLPDGFGGKPRTSKSAAIAKCSRDTDLCDVNALLAEAVLLHLRRPGGTPAAN